MPTRRPGVTEAIVRPRSVVWHGGGVHHPGARLLLTDQEFDELHFQRIIVEATPENVSAVKEAIERGLPIEGYVPTIEEDDDDPADAGAMRRRAHAARAARRPRPRS